jgi:hypothetical protein
MVGCMNFASHCGSYRENTHIYKHTYIHMKNVAYLKIKTSKQKILFLGLDNPNHFFVRKQENYCAN